MSDDEPIELEPVDELELFEPDQSILEISGVAETIRNFARSSFPCCVLDTGLRITWTNKRFSEHFPPGDRDEHPPVVIFPGIVRRGETQRAPRSVTLVRFRVLMARPNRALRSRSSPNYREFAHRPGRNGRNRTGCVPRNRR